MALFRNPRQTSYNSANPQSTRQNVTPVATGGVQPHHVISGTYSLQDRLAYTRKKIHAIPNASNFLKTHGGLPVSGWSGIVPFVRTTTGIIHAPTVAKTPL